MWERNRQGEPRRSIRRILGRSVCEPTVVAEVIPPVATVIDADGDALAVAASADIIDLTELLERRRNRDKVALFLSGRTTHIDDDFLPPAS